jgi:DNA-binding NtrC family response regulator
VLQQRTIQRVGSSQEIPVDFRLLAATHQDLGAAVRAGKFREDLYFRIVVFELEVPPIRARGADVSLLARHFVAEGAKALRGQPVEISEAALARLQAHGWPGNVRELQNVCQRALVTCDGGRIEVRDLPGRLGSEPALTPVAGTMPAWRPEEPAAASAAVGTVEHAGPAPAAPAPAPAPPPGSPYAAPVSAAAMPMTPADGVLTLATMERQAILDALSQFEGNRTRVSKELGIGRTTLYRKLKEYGIP